MEKEQETTMGGENTAEETQTGGESQKEEIKPEDNQEDDQHNGETPAESEKPNQALDDVIDGWREDRTKIDSMKRENAELKSKMERFEKKEEDEEYEGLSEGERIERIIAKKERQREEEKKTQDAEVAEEIRFFERSDKFFKENKKAIMKVAADFSATNLSQAVKIYKAQKKTDSKEKKKYDDKRKKKADGAPGGSSKGRTKSSYDPKKDGKKSFGDLYREGGVE